MRGRTHVAAAQDCEVDELVYAALIAYCHAAAGAPPSSQISPFSHPVSHLANLMLFACPLRAVATPMTLEDFRAEMTSAGWSLATHQLRLGAHLLSCAPARHKSS
jgi:hypothetical protein